MQGAVDEGEEDMVGCRMRWGVEDEGMWGVEEVLSFGQVRRSNILLTKDAVATDDSKLSSLLWQVGKQHYVSSMNL